MKRNARISFFLLALTASRPWSAGPEVAPRTSRTPKPPPSPTANLRSPSRAADELIAPGEKHFAHLWR